ncbi:MAG: addiction module toxin RelE [Bacteroidetes bacterium GWA2_40_15]|nr:MAG: addiction module toxin RelE [Bacteroidetes bacterium GWA2_40_15]HBQ81973.1 type II toxin-antitoxin system HigB family toxin [Bacteroidales bacterium]HCU20073.1 type II toxin-antitoxin system HigB family toxin [Bacteroidales bacterium]
MHIISFRKLREFFEEDSNSKVALQDWHKRAGKAEWNDFSDIKKTFNTVDSVGNSRFVFNVKGNHYRIVALILFQIKRVYIRWVGTHKDYDKIKNIDKI